MSSYICLCSIFYILFVWSYGLHLRT